MLNASANASSQHGGQIALINAAALGLILSEPDASEDRFDYAAAITYSNEVEDGVVTWATWNQGQQVLGSPRHADGLTKEGFAILATHAWSKAGYAEPIFTARYDKGTMTLDEKRALMEHSAHFLRDLGHPELGEQVAARSAQALGR